MPSRLQLKYGIVAEEDRLESSADALLVTEPQTGSKVRSKGNLYTVVTASGRNASRGRDATELVAQTLHREYYYDESAGIPVCLEKAVRTANKRLRQGREGHHVGRGAIGAAMVVVRGNEIYVATVGDTQVYLVRQARLLMPEHFPGEGLPNPDEVHVDVWRGEFAVGDSLLLVSGNVTEAVGTEELKNALVTLHPQSAVEHLHHLFVAAGGDGSDAVLALEASEVTATRAEKRLVPVAPDDVPLRSGDAPAPRAVAFAGAGGGVQTRTGDARQAVSGAFSSVADRVISVFPQRRPAPRRVTPLGSKRQRQQRAAIAALMIIVFIGGVGLLAWGLPSALPGDQQIPLISNGEQALRDAEDRVARVFGAGNLAATDAGQAVVLLREAWSNVARAESAGVPRSRTEGLRAQIADGLDGLPPYNVRRNAATTVHRFPAASDPQGLVLGPDGAAYVIDGRSVVRIDLTTRQAVPVVTSGEGPGDGIGRPKLLAAGGPELLIVDVRNTVWRWRPSDDQGGGTLGEIRIGGESTWGDDVVDLATYTVSENDGLYNLYVIDPSERQILRYRPTADGSGFGAAGNYLATANDAVSTFRELVIDGDVYVLTPDQVLKHNGGRQQAFQLGALPDAGDLRPGRELRLLADAGRGDTGRLYLWDARHGRILVFSKRDGSFVEQFIPKPPVQPFADLRGMFVVERAEDAPPVLVWLTKERLMSTVLAAGGQSEESPEPTASPSESVEPSAEPEPSESRRPRRTRRP